MGKYKTTRDCIHAVNQAKDPFDLKRVLQKYYPDAFINWEIPVCKVGDRLKRVIDKVTRRYLVVETAEGKSALLYLNTNVLWKHFSECSVMPFGNVSARAFSEMTNGMTIQKFTIMKKRKKGNQAT